MLFDFFKILTLLLLLTGIVPHTQAQTTQNIPFTRIGIGDIHQLNNMQSAAMGGLGASLRNSLYVNFNNPASYTSFLYTNIDAGVQSQLSFIATESQSLQTGNVRPAYINFGFPVSKKSGMSIGLQPFSTIGYNVEQIKYDSLYVGEYKYRFTGKGNTYQFYAGYGHKFKNLSAGINVGYLLGNIDYARYAEFYDTTNIYNTKAENYVLPRGFILKGGLQYEYNLVKNDSLDIYKKLIFGLTYKMQNNINTITDNVWTRFTYRNNDAINYSSIDTISATYEQKGVWRLPISLGFGANYYYHQHQTIGFNVNYTPWSTFTNNNKIDSNLTNELTLSMGMEFTPNINASQTYGKVVSYRFGAWYSTGSWQSNNKNIPEIGLSTGLGLPFRRSATRMNINLIFGNRGSIAKHNLRENYVAFSLGITLNDRWFIKSKID